MTDDAIPGEDDDEYILDSVKGTKVKRRMDVLNKSKLSKEELFELLGEDGDNDDSEV